MLQDYEKSIAEIILKLFPIEWMRYKMYVSENIYRNIPMLVFRLKNTFSIEAFNEFRHWIALYDGITQWKVFGDPLSKKDNYILSLAILEKLRQQCQFDRRKYNEKEMLGEVQYKKYCEKGVEDIPNLVVYLKNIYKC